MFSRSRRKAFVVIAAALIVGVTVCLFVSKARERKEFRSHTDAQGYRYRITVATGWKVETDVMAGLDTGRPYDFVLTPPAPIPLQRWIDVHLFHRPSADPDPIYLKALSVQEASGHLQIVNRYPEWTNWPQSPRHRQRHLQIDGYPTTLRGEEMSFGSKVYHTTVFAVYMPNHATFYTAGSAVAPSGAAQADREMEAILASFHIEKVGIPPGGKP